MNQRSIFSTEFWRSYWISIRRSRRDRRDLQFVLLTALVLLFFLAYCVPLLVYGFADRTLVFVLLPFLVFLLLRWIDNRREDRTIRKEADRAVNKPLRDRIAADGFALSVLLARAASEQLLREKELPPHIQIITRRAHLAQLRQLSLWESLPAGVRDLLLMPDGRWPQNAIDLWRSFEILRCIRWALRLDSTLVDLTHLPTMDYKSAIELLQKPERLLSGSGMLDTWDIRLARNQADAFFSRCYAEAIGRGIFKPGNPDSIQWANNLYQSARDPEQRDTLVSHYTVAELNDGTLRYVTTIAFHRYHCLQFLIKLLDGTKAWDDWIEFCFPDVRVPQHS